MTESGTGEKLLPGSTSVSSEVVVKPTALGIPVKCAEDCEEDEHV
jgi:hypothetical protein